VRQRLDSVLEEAISLLRPVGAYRVVEGTRAAALGVPGVSLMAGLAVCTIGPELEAEVAQRTATDRLLDALLLDTMGSVAADAAADALNRELCTVAHGLGKFTGPRSSPGYPGWGLERQGDLLALLPCPAIGIGLTESLMMVPRKSVSFAVAFHDHPVTHDASPCARCDRHDCTLRQPA
jgi:hypothetical protein